jgi:hypothetical protein
MQQSAKERSQEKKVKETEKSTGLFHTEGVQQ